MPALRNWGRPYKGEVHRRQSQNPPSKCEGGAPGKATANPPLTHDRAGTRDHVPFAVMTLGLVRRRGAALTFAGGRRTDGSEAVLPLLQGQLK